MIVIDASLTLDFILNRPHTHDIIVLLRQSNRSLFAPEIIDVEVLQALRKQVLLNRIDIETANISQVLLSDLPLTRVTTGGLLAAHAPPSAASTTKTCVSFVVLFVMTKPVRVGAASSAAATGFASGELTVELLFGLLVVLHPVKIAKPNMASAISA